MKKTYLFDDKAFETIEDALEAAEAAGWADDTQFENWLNRNFDAVDLFYRKRIQHQSGRRLQRERMRGSITLSFPRKSKSKESLNLKGASLK